MVDSSAGAGRSSPMTKKDPELALDAGTAELSREEQIYQAYPKKVAKPVALRAIRKALVKYRFEFLLEKTKAFAAVRGDNLEYVPYPATWFNQERFNDDPATWRPRDDPRGAQIRGTRENIDVPIHKA